MNTVLVVLALIGRIQQPQYAIRYPTQQLCYEAAELVNKRSRDSGMWSREPEARCVPEVRL